jgi:hypothetical protein
MKLRHMIMGSLALALVSMSVLATPAVAASNDQTIVIKDHKFVPDTIEIPADARIKLIVDNQDATPEEFESHDLRIEKIIPGNTKGIIRIGPLPKGEYSFVGEFHEDTAKGKIIVK